MCPRLWLFLPLALGACKPQRETVKKQVQLTTAPSAALTEAALAPPAALEQDVLAQVAKLILGVNPALDDRQDHIGLVNVAALVGYDLPLNDCGSPWQVAGEGKGTSFTLTITSRHDHGVGPSCGEANAAAPVAYVFRDWQVAPEAAAEWQPFTTSGSAAEAPPLRGTGGKELGPGGTVSGATSGIAAWTPSIDAQGRQLWSSQETVEVTSSGRPEGEVLVLQYVRSVPEYPEVAAVGQRATGYGVTATAGLAAKTEAGASAVPAPAVIYHAGVLEAPPLGNTWATAQCRAELAVPAGCRYKAVLTAHLSQRKSRFIAKLQVAPKSVGLRGRLGSKAPCNHRLLRQADGSCGGTMGAGGSGVEAWFGLGGVGFNFAEDLAAQASARQTDSAGPWDFAAMRLLPGQQSQGIPTIDWALRYFQLATYAKVGLVFEQFEESVTSCVVHAESMPGSPASCAQAPADQPVVPSLSDSGR